MRTIHTTIAYAIAGIAAFSGIAQASSARWGDDLTLSPRYAAEHPTIAKAMAGIENAFPVPTAGAGGNAFEASKYKPAAPASSSGLDCSPVFDNATAVEYRMRLGIGTGSPSNNAWSVSQVIRLGTDAGLAIYQLRGIGNVYDEGVRRAGVESTSNSNARTIGVSLQVRF